MAAPEQVIRFRFDFDDLINAHPPDLTVVRGIALPDDAEEVVGSARPRWLRPLLPVFTALRPMKVWIVGANAPIWAGRLQRALTALIASAADPGGVRVLSWADGFATGPPGLERTPAEPDAVVIAAECDHTSIQAARDLAYPYRMAPPYLALHGDLAALDRVIGLDHELIGRVRLVRFPLLRQSEVAAIAGPAPPRLGRGGLSRACLALAQALVDGHRAAEP